MSAELIIFDADGVLVDSMGLTFRVMAECLADEGCQVEAAALYGRFNHGPIHTWTTTIAELLRRPTPDGFLDAYIDRRRAVFDRELSPIDGVAGMLDRLDAPTCVATNGPMEKVMHTLRITDLLSWFDGRVYSAYEVGSFKPDPGLFLHAAEHCGTDAGDCVVVEDSPFGVEAALAAGMRAIGYAGPGGGDVDLLREAGAEVIETMSALPDVLVTISRAGS